MDNLREIRNELLRLHKTLLEIERENYENEYGKITNLQLLNLLFENHQFTWLREISILVAEMDEHFSSLEKGNIEFRNKLFLKSRELFNVNVERGDFTKKFNEKLETVKSVAEHHSNLLLLFEKEKE